MLIHWIQLNDLSIVVYFFIKKPNLTEKFALVWLFEINLDEYISKAMHKIKNKRETIN